MPLQQSALTRDLTGCMGDWGNGEVSLLGDTGTRAVRTLDAFVEHEDSLDESETGQVIPVRTPMLHAAESFQPGTRILYAGEAWQVSRMESENGVYKHWLQKEDALGDEL